MTAPTVSVGALTVGVYTATIPWTTDQPAASLIEYGTTASYGTTVTLTSVPDVRARLEWWTANSAQVAIDATADTLTAVDVTFTATGRDTVTADGVADRGIWTATATGLQPATTYTWRAVGTDSDGITWYATGTVTTAAKQAPTVGDVEVNAGPTDVWIVWRTDVDCDTSTAALVEA